MIRIKTIYIEEFRGIKKLELDLSCQNFGICGPNGTGKSGVVDAIEFCLTGNLTRLSGAGAGELSLKGHAPHVDQRANPAKAKVSLVAVAASTGQEITITRSVNSPRVVNVSPVGVIHEEVVRELQIHPEFALSRREIAKYIIAQPAKRSEYVQDLLRLDQIGKTRGVLLTYANKCKREYENAEATRSRAEYDFKTALGVQKLDRADVLAKVNAQRRFLGLTDLVELTKDTLFSNESKDAEMLQRKPVFEKSIAIADLNKFSSFGTDLPEILKTHSDAAQASLLKLKSDEKLLRLARQHGLITSGLELVNDDACPLCDEPWDAEDLREHLRQKLLSAQTIGEQLDALQEALRGLLVAVDDRIDYINKLLSYNKNVLPDDPADEIKAYSLTLTQARETILSFIENRRDLDSAISVSKALWWSVPGNVGSKLANIRQNIEKLPDTSSQEKAKTSLAVLQDRYDRLIEWSSRSKDAKTRGGTAEYLHTAYNEISNGVLEKIYDAVAEDFSKFYKALNDDESGFAGELKSDDAKLSFNVEFYGKGKFPPGAYHSEGHQDGMGLCLYLALMKHTLGPKFTFAVLDDVLMSVDTGHRREVCRLLSSEFRETQFILTTHDRIWLQYMKSEGLIRKGQIFSGWHISTGPRIWESTDVWTQISEFLDKDEVALASSTLRRYLEYISSILADNLRAQVEYREDANYDLSDLLPPVYARWKDRLKKGAKVAKKWGNDAETVRLEALLVEASRVIGEAEGERKPINECIHFNKWENYTKAEFKIVADAFREFLDHVRCQNSRCGGLPYLAPRKGRPEQLRCSCQGININLKDE